MTHDVLLIHPPSIYDFRKRPLFPGPIAYTVGESTEQFVIPPIGMLSIADYLDRNGYKVMVDNLGERMVTDKAFDAERYVEGTSARVYGIGLHWCVHSQGALEVAKLCKKLHPDSLVVMGGLTATRFHEEIIQKYEFVDAVIRGEAEKPFLQLMTDLDKYRRVKDTPNATYRSDGGKVVQEPMMKLGTSIDEFEFTRLDLLEPKGSVYRAGMPPHWSLPVCRGCLYNCATCGGSAYSYRTYLGRERPAFRSPKKIAEDLQKLSDQGVRYVFLFQDPRMGGRKYQEELITTLREEKMQMDRLTMELFKPADQDYIRELSGIGVPITLTISPESGVDSTRMIHGRGYTNEVLLKTIEACQKYAIHLMVFFMLGLAEETRETMEETWKLWKRISSVDQAARTRYSPGTVSYAFGPMVLLDPGSLAFDFPEKHGYRLISGDLEGYVKAMASPSWHQWISYETKSLDKDSIVGLTLDSIERSIAIREEHGIYDRPQAAKERLRYVDANRWAIGQVDRIMRMSDERDRTTAMASIRRNFDEYCG